MEGTQSLARVCYDSGMAVAGQLRSTAMSLPRALGYPRARTPVGREQHRPHDTRFEAPCRQELPT